jgi:hypothetical protein
MWESFPGSRRVIVRGRKNCRFVGIALPNHLANDKASVDPQVSTALM